MNFASLLLLSCSASPYSSSPECRKAERRPEAERQGKREAERERERERTSRKRAKRGRRTQRKREIMEDNQFDVFDLIYFFMCSVQTESRPQYKKIDSVPDSALERDFSVTTSTVWRGYIFIRCIHYTSLSIIVIWVDGSLFVIDMLYSWFVLH